MQDCDSITFLRLIDLEKGHRPTKYLRPQYVQRGTQL